MKGNRLQSILSRWFTAMLATVILILCLVIGMASSRYLRGTIGSSLANTAYQTSARLDQFMWSRMHELEILLSMDAICSGTDSTAAEAALNQLKSSFPSFAWIGLTDENGNVRAATDGILVGESIAQRPVYLHGLEGQYIGDVHEALLLASRLPNPTGEPLRFVDISHPVYDKEGKRIGVLAAHLNWQWAEQEIAEITSSLPHQDQISIYVVSRDNTVLLGPAKDVGARLISAALRGAPSGYGWTLETLDGGKTVLTGYALSQGYLDYPGLGWSILVRQPAREAYSDVGKMQLVIVASGILFAVLFLFVGRVLAQRITSPLKELTQAAEGLRRGEAASILKDSGIQEIEILEDTLFSLFNGLNRTELALDKMELLAKTDPLTGLPNRAAFYDFVAVRTLPSQPEKTLFSVLYLDLDGFKAVNDTLGHQNGDLLLVEVGKRIQACLGAGELAARLGGDEFAAVLLCTGQDIDAAEQEVFRRGRRLLEALNRTFLLENKSASVGCIIGAAIWPADSADASTLIRQADQALYHAKLKGKNQLVFYRELPAAQPDAPSTTR